MVVSIVTVTLNPGDLLRSTIESVLGLTWDDWELIIQDGGSEDGSLDQIGDDARIKIFKEEDSGIYDAMNRAVSKASGNYVIFLNAGDCFATDEILAKVATLAEQEGHPELVFCDYRNVAANRSVSLPDSLNTVSLFRAAYCHQAVFFARQLFDELGFYDTSYPIRADLEFLYRCHARSPKARAARVPECGILYEGQGISAASEVQQRKAEELDRIRRAYHSPWSLRLFRVLHELTLVRLRNWWYRRSLRPNN